ncbi:RNA polymerase sigma factor [Gemmatimonadota bacterium]
MSRKSESSLCDWRIVVLCLAVSFGAQALGLAVRFNEPGARGVSPVEPRFAAFSLDQVHGMESSPTDAALVKRVRRGDTQAFETLVRRHLRAARAVALSALGDTHDADDVCQDAFLSALGKIEQCRNPERFRAWLLAIVRNRALGYRSYEAVRKATPVENAPDVISRDDPGKEVERRELREDIAEALEDLSEYQRRVVVLHDLEGWTHKEIADELGISQGSSRVHLHVARRNLRSHLAPRHLKLA